MADHFYIERMAAPHNEEGPAEDEFAQLAIPKEHKQLILALVRSHSRGKLATPGKAVDIRPEMDLVRGKGKGLIILLHGVPGVGKTSTAESIASFTKRPLYPITCGDLGETAREVEESLEAHFTLAHRWGCILLLDEADVFLAKRERGDIKRNALVSVFLRVLEYYPGILFLTTNRVGSFDEAFKSRIHIALYYPPLSRDFTLQVWSSCLAQIERQNPQREAPVKFDRGKLLEFAEEQYNSDTPWNGRQIRNAFQTAIALADYERAEKRRIVRFDSSPVPEKVCKGTVGQEPL
ncbi:P-loop containing nucleoside triphosphate hydrolase protein [Aspergillus carlsbadensis]|nr:P-loop containing nucleoside triphosphate hydrolase protein [Aspergillus carlsbadensis]